MSAWSLVITDPSGSHGCADCGKARGCLSKETLEEAFETLIKISESPAHPVRSGWGTLRTVCHGYSNE